MPIHTIDLKFQNVAQTIASYAIIGGDGVILIETGPGSTVENAIRSLGALGIKPSDVRHVFVTHIHLDHAGAAGWWAQQGAHVYVHHVGMPHLVDPSRLLRSAGRIYGDKMDSLWGEMLPIAPDSVTAMHDGDRFELGSISLTAWDTPGHAWHHMTLLMDDVAFVGDVGAVRLPGYTWVSLPAPPPEFKMDVWLKSLDRLESAEFRRIYPTHFGPYDDVAAHFGRTRVVIREHAEFIRQQMSIGELRDTILQRYEAWNRSRAMSAGLTPSAYKAYETANPLYMSVDGIMRYWRRSGSQ